MQKKENKYENIEMLDLENKVEDIEDIYIDCLFNTDKTVGLIANKELIEYILYDIIKLDDTSVKEIDLVDYMNINEYLLSVDNDGYITCVPIEDLCVLDNTDIFYIDMDGDIKQDIVDYCVNEDKEVILFGQKDDCDGDCENCSCMDDSDDTYVHLSDGDDGNTHGFTASKSDGDSYMSYSYYSSDELSQDDIRSMLKAFGF